MINYEKIISVNDNIFKFLSLLGALLILFAVIYPNEKLKEYTNVQSEAILKSKQLELQLDDAIKLNERLESISKRTTDISVKDSLQQISDITDKSIKEKNLEIEHLNRLVKFNTDELTVFYDYRNWIIGFGIGFLSIGLILWTIFYIRTVNKSS